MSELRSLPRSQVRWERDADVVVVGSGAAGMAAALAAARPRPPGAAADQGRTSAAGATPLAQGGLAAAIGPGDSPALHQRDTLDAGAGLCDPAAVAALVSGPRRDRPAGRRWVPGWSGPRCTWRAGTAAGGS